MTGLASVESISEDIRLACELTQQIIDLASRTELDDLEVLNERRLGLIESIFSNEKSNINVAKAKQLLTLNTEAMAVLQHQMILNINEQKKARKGNTAHNAYMNHSA